MVGKGEGQVEDLKMHTVYELLDMCKKYRTNTEYRILAAREIEVLRLPTKYCEYNPIEIVWSQIKGYVASRNVTSTSLLNMRQLVLEAFDSSTPEYCRKVCEHVRRLKETTLEAEMAMDPMVERMIIEVDSSGDEDVVSDDEEEEQTPPNLTNTKSNEDQMIQKVIREHNKIYQRRKSDQYTGCACKGYCNTKKIPLCVPGHKV